MGYLLQKALRSELNKIGFALPVVTVVTQCLVSPTDNSSRHPTKPIGRFYAEVEAEECKRRFGWTIVMDADRGYRRVVPSPQPLEILEFDVIQKLFRFGALVIACGGGGIPVCWMDGELVGVEAVIDKDLASSLLASQLGVDLFVIGTDTDHVYCDFGKPSRRPFHDVTATELEKHLQAGEFAPGSMAPKVEAALQFLRRGGKEAVIASCRDLRAAVKGTTGTHVFADEQRIQPAREFQFAGRG